MNKKNIKKIIIPAIAIIVIIGGLVVYFVKPQEAQSVMAPLDTQQDLVEEKEEIPEEPQEDIAIDNKEEENEIENTAETEATPEEETTDTILSEEYQGDEETDLANMGLTEEELEILKQLDMDLTEEDWEIIKQLEAEVIAEYPELFTDTNPNTTNSTTKASGYVSVDAPVDNGEQASEMEFNGDYSEGAGAQVY